MVTAVSWGLACFGWVCIAVALLFPTPPQAGRPWLNWVMLTFAVIFFLIAAALGFGWVKA